MNSARLAIAVSDRRAAQLGARLAEQQPEHLARVVLVLDQQDAGPAQQLLRRGGPRPGDHLLVTGVDPASEFLADMKR